MSLSQPLLRPRLRDLVAQLRQAYADKSPLGPEAARTAISVREAYRVQQQVVEGQGLPAGWKVGRKTSAGPANRAPLFQQRLFASEAVLDSNAFRLWRLEAELMFRLGRDLPERARPYTGPDIAAVVEEVIVAFEIVDSRFLTWPNLSPELLVADCLSHGAMVLGSGTTFSASMDLQQAFVRLDVDGTVVVEQRGGNPAGDILDLTAQLANDLGKAGGKLKKGDLVTTGSYTGMQFLPPGARAEARFEGIGSVAVRRGAGEAGPPI